MSPEMATPIEKPSFFWTYCSPFLLGGFRAGVGTPIDVVATREILHHKTTLQVLRETAFADYRRGFQPNALKFISRTPAQFFFTSFFSSNIPTDLNPAVRGFLLGLSTSGAEAALFNIFNSARTRFIQGARWRDLMNEGPPVLVKGLSAAWSHRALSSAIFYTVYEPLKERYPNEGSTVSTIAGFVQVFLTSPFFIAAIERQRKDAPKESLHQTILRLFKTQGFFRGLVIPALVPRLVHTALVTPLFMYIIDDKLRLIQRIHKSV